jgi:XapX domain-containing protein
MQVYLLSLGAGLLVGVIYSLIGVRSPAPPVIALVGLLGILLGQQVSPLIESLSGAEPTVVSELRRGFDPRTSRIPNIPPVPASSDERGS